MIKLPSKQIPRKIINFEKLAGLFLLAFIFCFPFQIRTLIFTNDSYLGGNFNQFTVFFLYFGDLLLVLSLIFWGLNLIKNGKKISFGDSILSILLFTFLAFLGASVMIGGFNNLSFFIFLRSLQFSIFYFLMINQVAGLDLMVKAFFASIFFQSSIAILQYLNQGSLVFKFLGEPVLSPTTLGVAKIDIGDFKMLRGYGTFSHPNVLAGSIFVAIILGFSNFKKFQIGKKKFLLAIFLLVTGLVVTFSRSAFVAFILAILIYLIFIKGRIYFRKLLRYVFGLVPLFLLVLFRFLNFSDQSVAERFLYLQISEKMLLANPLGVGLGNFTLYMQQFTDAKLLPWLEQPVHNVFLLVANEAGILAGLLFLFIFIYLFWAIYRGIKKANKQQRSWLVTLVALLLGLFSIAMVDHYFFTTYQGQFLLFFYLGLASIFLKKSLLPRKKS